MKRSLAQGLVVVTIAAICCTEKIHAQANTSLSNLTAPTSVNTDLLPDSDDTRDFGSAPRGWRSLYITNSIYLRAQKFLSGDINNNITIGIGSGSSLTSGSSNISLGYAALNQSTSGNHSIAIGAYSLLNAPYSEYNIAIGSSAMGLNNLGYENLAIGVQAGYSNLNGTAITALGHYSLMNNTADNVTAVGHSAMIYNTTGTQNTAMGTLAMANNTSASNNTAIGYAALQANITGEENTAIGASALTGGVGYGNTAIGFRSLHANTSGEGTAVGLWSGYSSWTGWGNSFFGAYAAVGPTNATNATALGYLAFATASDQVRIGNEFVTSIGGYAGWTNLSDGRFKKNLRENVPGLEFINKLRPVTYTIDVDGIEAALKPTGSVKAPQRKVSAAEIASKAGKAKMIHTGFVAQDVEKAAQELGFDFSGVDAPKNDHDFYGLRYAEFVVPLVKAVQQLDEENDQLKQQNASLEERIKKLEDLVMKNTETKTTSIQLSSARLEQNAPNPFNGSTLIGYSIPGADGNGRISITDMKGVMIKSFNINGKGQINLHKGSLASGEYLYSLWIGEKLVDTKKMSVK